LQETTKKKKKRGGGRRENGVCVDKMPNEKIPRVYREECVVDIPFAFHRGFFAA
jgi:hypothetical protein